MPKDGWQSITVRDDIYDQWFKWYAARRFNLKIEHGITSFGGMMSMILANQKPENHSKIVEPLLKVTPDKKGVQNII